MTEVMRHHDGDDLPSFYPRDGASVTTNWKSFPRVHPRIYYQPNHISAFGVISVNQRVVVHRKPMTVADVFAALMMRSPSRQSKSPTPDYFSAFA